MLPALLSSQVFVHMFCIVLYYTIIFVQSFGHGRPPPFDQRFADRGALTRTQSSLYSFCLLASISQLFLGSVSLINDHAASPIPLSSVSLSSIIEPLCPAFRCPPSSSLSVQRFAVLHHRAAFRCLDLLFLGRTNRKVSPSVSLEICQKPCRSCISLSRKFHPEVVLVPN